MNAFPIGLSLLVAGSGAAPAPAPAPQKVIGVSPMVIKPLQIAPLSANYRSNCSLLQRADGSITPVLENVGSAMLTANSNIVLVIDEGTVGQFPLPTSLPMGSTYVLPMSSKSSARKCMAITLNVRLEAVPIAP